MFLAMFPLFFQEQLAVWQLWLWHCFFPVASAPSFGDVSAFLVCCFLGWHTLKFLVAPVRTLASSFLGFCLWFPSFFVVSPVKWVYLNHRSRRLIARKLRHAVQTDEIELTGKLRYDYQGPYLEVNTARGLMKVRVSSADMFPLVHTPAPAAKYGNESVMPRSMVLPGPMPKYIVEFLSGGRVVGAGFRTSVGKQDVIMTATHVIRGLMSAGAEFVLRRDDREVVVDDEMKKLILLAVEAPGLDVVGFTLPQQAVSYLGITKGKMAKTPVQTAVRSHGVYQGESVSCTGTITKTLGSFLFKHNATTVPGFSGSPLTTPSGAIIGMHLKGFPMFNEGVSLDLFVAQGRMESDFVLQAYHMDFDQDDYDDILDTDEDRAQAAIWQQECRFRNADSEFSVTVIGSGNRYDVKRTEAGMEAMRNYVPKSLFNWADDYEEEDDLHFESDFRGLPKTLGASSATMTGLQANASKQVTESISRLSAVTETLLAELNASRDRPQPISKPSQNSGTMSGLVEIPQPSENPSAGTQKCTKEPTPVSPLVSQQPPKPKAPKRTLSKGARALLPQVQGLFEHQSRDVYEKHLVLLESDEAVRKAVTSELELRMQQRASARLSQKLGVK